MATTFATDVDVLNYALTLEHFESALYKALIAANKLTDPTEQKYLTAFGKHEATHVTLLTEVITLLGGTPVAPRSMYNLPMIASRDDVVNNILSVEDVGASAYLGAAGMIQSKDLLEVAVNIHNVEAEHASAWRFVANMKSAPDTIAKGRTPDEVLMIVTPFLGPA